MVKTRSAEFASYDYGIGDIKRTLWRHALCAEWSRDVFVAGGNATMGYFSGSAADIGVASVTARTSTRHTIAKYRFISAG